MTRVLAPRPGGVVSPLVTPMKPEGSLDEAVLRGLIDALAPSPDGLFVLGSSSELPWLPDALSGLKATLQALDWNVGEPSATIPPYGSAQRVVVDGMVSTPGIARSLTMPPVPSGPPAGALE